MEFLTQFGFDPILFAAQIVNFLIVLFVLKKFLYKPILSMMEKRKKTIQEGLEQAEEARQRLEKVVEEEKAILKKAQSAAIKIIDDAKSHAQKTIKDAETAATKRTEKMIADAKAAIDEQAAQTEKRLTGHISEVSVDFLKKALSTLFTEKNQTDIMERAIKEIRKKSN